MKLLIVDDDPLVCQSLQLLLGKEEGFQIIGTASNGQEAVALSRNEQPDVILMDIQMPVMDGIESTKIIKQEAPSIHIMMLTTFKDEKNIRLALRAGAEGYLLKSSPINKMAAQIRALVAGTTVLDPDVLRIIIEPTNEPDKGSRENEGLASQTNEGLAGQSNEELASRANEGLPSQVNDVMTSLSNQGLTKREMDIVELVAHGLSNKEIGEQLFIGDGTVRNTLSIILDKLELRDRTQLAIKYWQGKQ
ncbi:response regulator transcription factor [Paenibacillus sp. FSL W7-1287]|uniref:response regulator transcription factor n=1 Tax=Paenibacillus sp. FSL W7-1287 TaxID=2954538 RepID=UPI0030FCBC80